MAIIFYIFLKQYAGNKTSAVLNILINNYVICIKTIIPIYIFYGFWSFGPVKYNYLEFTTAIVLRYLIIIRIIIIIWGLL